MVLLNEKFLALS